GTKHTPTPPAGGVFVGTVSGTPGPGRAVSWEVRIIVSPCECNGRNGAIWMPSVWGRLRRARAVRAARGGKEQREDRAVLASALDTHLSMMLLHDVLYHRQAQADALFLAVTDEGLKQAGADLCWNARTV